MLTDKPQMFKVTKILYKKLHLINLIIFAINR